MPHRWNTTFYHHWVCFFLALMCIGIAGVRVKFYSAYQRQEQFARQERSGDVLHLTQSVVTLRREVLFYLVIGGACLVSNGGILLSQKLFGNGRVAQTQTPPRHRWKNVLIMVVGFYLISFGVFYSLDGSFTRLLSTTPYCYPHPIFRIYQPLVTVAWRVGWHGGGEFVDWMGY